MSCSIPAARSGCTRREHPSHFATMPHILELSLEVLPLALVDLTHIVTWRASPGVCSALRIAVGEARRVCERLSIADIGLTPYDITLVPLGSPLRVNCIAPIAGKDDPPVRLRNQRTLRLQPSSTRSSAPFASTGTRLMA